MKRNLIAVVLFGVASAQAGVASAGTVISNGTTLSNGLSFANGINFSSGLNFSNGLTFSNGVNLQARRVSEGSFDTAPSSTVGPESVAARPTSECIIEPERCLVDAPRSEVPGVVQSITLPDGSTYAVR
jgi:hypothetical protein